MIRKMFTYFVGPMMARQPGTCGGCGREAGTGHTSDCPYG